MSVQIINDRNGKPEYAVVPYDLYLQLTANEDEGFEDIPFVSDETDDVAIPHAVVGIQIESEVSLLAAWRIYRGMSQQEAAEKLGITQAAVSQLEATGSRPQKRTREKLAALYDCQPEQLIL
ncbi:XRE family transcriptional regulator [Atlantibacter subterranea]|uniref:XRE family transcriptional regulator n=1 Tax=Atlantibacter subterraneus TaxID=255519 RepID=A0A3R9EYA3_9ENTR|nr:helix-turn-helix transcriptional regulator [Atlantibacter subterranea]RSB61539.1 XRE family transcriptional regulator [Atlantibacter subterranea]RSE04656.1 XRE family transcriptional regulator [Atlantibacter subterranea]RSE24473.1 XRE family transcriptional regulator [Atlantibacter subterranea]